MSRAHESGPASRRQGALHLSDGTGTGEDMKPSRPEWKLRRKGRRTPQADGTGNPDAGVFRTGHRLPDGEDLNGIHLERFRLYERRQSELADRTVFFSRLRRAAGPVFTDPAFAGRVTVNRLHGKESHEGQQQHPADNDSFSFESFHVRAEALQKQCKTIRPAARNEIDRRHSASGSPILLQSGERPGPGDLHKCLCVFPRLSYL